MTEQIFIQLFIMIIPAAALWKIQHDYKYSQKKENPVEEFKAVNRTRFGGLAGALLYPMVFIIYIASKISSFIHPDKYIPEFSEAILPLIIVWALYYPLCIVFYFFCLSKLEEKYPSQSDETVNKNIMRVLRHDFLFFLFFLILWYFVVSNK